MKAKVTCALILLGLSATFTANAATEHYGKTISLLEVPMGDCYFFKLDDVSLADASVPGSPWFAIQKDQANAKEMYALLLSVRASGATLFRVATTNDIVCGAAQVATIDL